jgi:hypothetical protein
MLFTIQTYLEEYLIKRNLVDTDGYAVRLANLYYYNRLDTNDELFLQKISRINTVLFLNNGINNRKEFEYLLIQRLDNKFKKKLISGNLSFPGGTEVERKKFQQVPRLTINVLLNEFSSSIESKAIDTFWLSRKKGSLIQNPEKIAQGLFAMFTKGTLLNRSGIILREFLSGIGYVDVGIIFSSTLHLVEIKILTDDITGPVQLEQYMKTEKRKEGSLLIFDTLKPKEKIEIPSIISMPVGKIKVYRIDINPIPPSRLN